MMEKSGSTCTAEEMGCKKSSIVNKDDTPQYHFGDCAICLNKIVLQETALVKGCEHAYWFVCYQISFSFCYCFSSLCYL